MTAARTPSLVALSLDATRASSETVARRVDRYRDASSVEQTDDAVHQLLALLANARADDPSVREEVERMIRFIKLKMRKRHIEDIRQSQAYRDARGQLRARAPRPGPPPFHPRTHLLARNGSSPP